MSGVPTLKEVASGEALKVPCADDSLNGTCPGDIVVSIKDAFNQTITCGIQDASLELSIVSDNVAGSVHYSADNGKAIINDTQARGIGVDANVTIQSALDPRIQIKANFSTRRCRPGEFESGQLCQKCPTESYGFFPPLRQCQPCEEGAICRGEASLVPLDGYWHSTPFSPQFHPCIMRSSCTYRGRREQLEAFYNDSTLLETELLKVKGHVYETGDFEELQFPSYEQCAPGFEGPLCGSCSSGYGHGLSGACETCPSDRRVANFLLAVVLFWTMVLIGINCVVTLFSARARIQLVRVEQRDQTTNKHARRLRRMDQHIQETNTIRSRLSRMNTVSGTSIISDVQARQILAQQLVATVQLTETYKILVNYLQVTSAAMRLPVDWSATLNALLSIKGEMQSTEAQIEKV